MFYSCTDSIKADLEYQRQLLVTLEKANNHYKRFTGSYLTVHTRKNSKYYYETKCENGKERLHYLGNEEHPDVVALQKKHFIECTIKWCRNNIKLLEKVVREYHPIDPDITIPMMGAAYRDNINVASNLFPNKQASEWKAKGLNVRDSFERPFPEDLILPAMCGELMRTRGEVIIGDALFLMGIDFVYEWPRTINGVLRYPDFIVLHPKTKKEILIEYMGMYSDQGYRERNNPKFEEYFEEGWILGQNFFVFMDDGDMKIDAETIYKVLKGLFTV